MIASSRWSNSRIAGHRAEGLLVEQPGVGGHVLVDGRGPEVAGVADAPAAGQHRGAALHGVLGEHLHGVEPAGVGERAHLGAFGQPVADGQAVGALGQRRAEVLGDGAVDEEAGGGDADLARVAELGARRAVFTASSRSASSATITGAWPPSSIDTRFMCWPASAASCLPTARRAGEGDLADHRVRDEVAGDLGRVAVHQRRARRRAGPRPGRRGRTRPARPGSPRAP